MDLNAVAVFRDVVKHGSFTAAARASGVSPSHISRQVAALEAELKVRLFQRTTRKVVLTEAGAAYARRVEPLLDELEGSHARLQDASKTPRGTLRIAAAPAFAHEVMLPWLVELRAMHPQLVIEMRLEDRVSDLVEQKIDLAIRLGRMEASTLIARKLATMPRMVVASPEYLTARGAPVCPADIARHECLVFPFEGYRPSWRFRHQHPDQTERVDVSPALVVPDGISLRQLALSGAGLALLPDWLVARPLREGRLVDVFPSYDVTGTAHDAGVYLVYPSRDYLPLRVRIFIDYVAAQFEGGAPWHSGAARNSFDR